MKLRNAVGGAIRKVRTEQGLTLREVSGRRYISLGYWSDVETGKKDVSSTMLENMANALDLTTAELIMEVYNYLEEHK
jgi:transcriptional regulator with XRE-family HTH domain